MRKTFRGYQPTTRQQDEDTEREIADGEREYAADFLGDEYHDRLDLHDNWPDASVGSHRPSATCCPKAPNWPRPEDRGDNVPAHMRLA